MKGLVGTVWLVLLAASCGATAQESAPAEPVVYRVGVETLAYPPYSKIHHGELVGLNRELLDHFAEYAGIRFHYIAQPYIRNVKEFLGGRLDFQYPDDPAWLPEEKKGVSIHYSDHAVPYTDGFVQLASRPNLSFDQVNSVGTIIGFTLTGYYERVHSGRLQLSEQGNVRSLVDQVLYGRIDGAYLSEQVVEHQLRELGREGALRFNPDLPYHTDFYRLASTQHPELIAQFNRFLVEERVWIADLLARHRIAAFDPEVSPEESTLEAYPLPAKTDLAPPALNDVAVDQSVDTLGASAAPAAGSRGLAELPLEEQESVRSSGDNGQ